jgi:hypothetical protein
MFPHPRVPPQQLLRLVLRLRRPRLQALLLLLLQRLGLHRPLQLQPLKLLQLPLPPVLPLLPQLLQTALLLALFPRHS